jgi:enoyl-CoA hydratase/carnithine racemase
MNFQNLKFTSDKQIIWVEMRKSKNDRNSLDSTLLDELLLAVHLSRQQEEAKLLVLSGHGRVFSVGADISEMESMSPDDAVEFLWKGQTLIRALIDLEIPTLAAVNGLALGGGFELALACDIRWAHARAAFGFPECKLGIIPAWGGAQLIRLHLPVSLSTELLMSGDYLGAESAHRLGLVSRIIHGEVFLQKVAEGVRKFTAIQLQTLKGLKSLTRPAPHHLKGLSQETTIFLSLWGHMGQREKM